MMDDRVGDLDGEVVRCDGEGPTRRTECSAPHAHSGYVGRGALCRRRANASTTSNEMRGAAATTGATTNEAEASGITAACRTTRRHSYLE